MESGKFACLPTNWRMVTCIDSAFTGREAKAIASQHTLDGWFKIPGLWFSTLRYGYHRSHIVGKTISNDLKKPH